jgi:hypothetical protein
MPATADQERCHRCDHQRRYHTPRCTKEDCPCGGFSKMTVDRDTVRSRAEMFIGKAVLELRDAFSSDEEIKKEMHEAVDRIIDQSG